MTQKLKMILAVFLSAVALAACQPDLAEEVEDISINGMNGTQTINYSETINLDVDGSGNTITIASTIKELDVDGMNNVITINDGVQVESISIDGSGNTINKPASLQTLVDDDGLNNSVVDY